MVWVGRAMVWTGEGDGAGGEGVSPEVGRDAVLMEGEEARGQRLSMRACACCPAGIARFAACCGAARTMKALSGMITVCPSLSF